MLHNFTCNLRMFLDSSYPRIEKGLSLEKTVLLMKKMHFHICFFSKIYIDQYDNIPLNQRQFYQNSFSENRIFVCYSKFKKCLRTFVSCV